MYTVIYVNNNFCLDGFSFFCKKADARAIIKGSEKYSGISGVVLFYQINDGVIVSAEIDGLPKITGKCPSPIFAFHIHSGTSCTGNATDPFAEAGMHYNPQNVLHPCHAGDLPPLFSANGKAFAIFLTDRFSVKEIIGKTVIIHGGVDDFTSQPSGNAGEKIACGEIKV